MSTIKKLEELFAAGKATDVVTYPQWKRRVKAFLTAAIDDTTSGLFYRAQSNSWEIQRDEQLGFLEGLIVALEKSEGSGTETKLTVVSPPKISNRVFVVHGHDGEAKETTARFLERLGLDVIILHEQPNSGRTIIEKLEDYSDVGFAVVLLTPDDVGSAKAESDKLRPRARQNVIAELGHFVGRLTRKRVCALHKEGVEIPSDYSGVVYVPMDKAGAWKTKLAQELVSVGLSINLEALLKS